MILPLSLSLSAGELLGIAIYYLWQSRRRIAIKAVEETFAYLKRAFPEKAEHWKVPHEIVKAMFKNLGRSFVELVRIYWGDEEVFRRIRFRGLEVFERAKQKGKGIIFLTGHCGNWELMAIAFGRKVEPIGVVARPLNSKGLNSLIEEIRTGHGNHVIYKKGAVREILRDLRDNRAVGILMDQSVLRQEGLLIDFLGRPAWTSRMPALIARKTEAVVLPAFIKRDGDGHLVEIFQEVELTGDEEEDTKRLSSFIERYIIENPEEWLWIHRRWKRRDVA